MTRERRQFIRTSQPVDLRYRLCGELSAPWTITRTVNLSAGGARFRCQEPLRQSDELDLRLQLSGSPRPLELRACVVWNQMQAAGVNEIGVAFLDVTHEQQMQIDALVHFLGQGSFPTAP